MIPNASRDFNFDLGETADAIRESVRNFAQSEIAPRAEEIDRTNQFPIDLWPRMGALGLHGITVEEEFGGSGLGYLEHCVAMEEVSRASASVGLSYGAHSNLCVNQIRRNGTDAQKRRYLPQLISGEHGPLVIETGHQDLHAPADLAEHVFLRHLAILEHEFARVRAAHAELVELLGGGEPLHALLDQKRRDAARPGIEIGLGIDDQRLGFRTVGDPHLGAVEDVTVTLLLGAGAHRDYVGAGARLGHRQRADMLAGDQLRQIFVLLRIGAVAADLIDAEIGMRAVGQADRGGCA